MNLKDRFNSLTGDQVVAMKGEQETLRLDFKGWSAKDHDNRKSLSVAISGFANSEGGLLIWGVDARKGDDGIDRVEETPGLDADRVLNLLNEWTADSVSPRQPAVDHRVVRSAEGLGFVISYMPMTLGEPVMAHDNRFYHRCGTRFMQMEQYHVSNMYGRRAKPQLFVSVRIKDRVRLTANWGLWLGISIRNTGMATAHNVLLVIGTAFKPEQHRPSPRWEVSPRVHLPALDQKYDQSAYVPVGASPIHPGTEHAAARIDTPGQLDREDDLLLTCFAMCDEAPPARSDLVIHRADVQHFLNSYGRT